MTDTTLSPPVAGPDIFTIGGVFNRTFAILSRNIVVLVLLNSPIFLPFLLIGIAFLLDPALHIQPGRQHLDDPAPVTIVLFGLAGLAFLVAMLVVQIVTLHAAFEAMRGRPIRPRESIAAGLARLLPVIGTAFCMMLVAIAGFIALIVPGYILLIAMYVAIPACMVERLGPIASIRRSMRLTKGHRWRIFGLLVAVGIGGGIASSFAEMPGFISGPVVGLVFYGVWMSVYTAFTSTLYAVLYHDLRVAAEGLDTDQIAAVFD